MPSAASLYQTPIERSSPNIGKNIRPENASARARWSIEAWGLSARAPTARQQASSRDRAAGAKSDGNMMTHGSNNNKSAIEASVAQKQPDHHTAHQSTAVYPRSILNRSVFLVIMVAYYTIAGRQVGSHIVRSFSPNYLINHHSQLLLHTYICYHIQKKNIASFTTGAKRLTTNMTRDWQGVCPVDYGMFE